MKIKTKSGGVQDSVQEIHPLSMLSYEYLLVIGMCIQHFKYTKKHVLF